MSKYIPIPVESIREALTCWGMVEKATKSSRYSPGEIYFEKSVFPSDVGLVVKVYTSVSVGGGIVRGCGKDAIRTCLIWRSDEEETQTAGLYKASKVLRVTSVDSTLCRVQQRVREMHRKATYFHLEVPSCPVCGCPVWEDSKRCRNRKCGTRVAAVTVSPDAGASRRFASAYGASYSPVPRAQVRKAVPPRPVRPVDPGEARKRLDEEAARNRREDPILSKGEMPPELRGLF